MATAVDLDAPRRTPTTAEELILWPDDDPGEIVDGVFVPKYGSGEVRGEVARYGIVVAALGSLVANHVKAHRLGRTVLRAGFRLRRAPDTVRVPALAFVAAERLAAGIPEGVFEGAPNLAVEVLSRANTAAKVGRRVADYLRYGTRAVCVADPAARLVVVHRPGMLPRTYRGDDVLDGGDVLPDLRVVTSDIFADLDPYLAPNVGRNPIMATLLATDRDADVPPDGTPMTLTEFLALPNAPRAELVDGRFRVVPLAGGPHGSVNARLIMALGAHVFAHASGDLYDASVAFVLRTDPPLVRSPDVSFVGRGKDDPTAAPGSVPLAPDLAVETLSPSDRADEVQRKIAEYFEHGTELVWLIDPQHRSAVVYTRGGRVQWLHAGDLLEGGDVLPGISVPLAFLFAGLALPA